MKKIIFIDFILKFIELNLLIIWVIFFALTIYNDILPPFKLNQNSIKIFLYRDSVIASDDKKRLISQTYEICNKYDDVKLVALYPSYVDIGIYSSNNLYKDLKIKDDNIYIKKNSLQIFDKFIRKSYEDEVNIVGFFDSDKYGIPEDIYIVENYFRKPDIPNYFYLEGDKKFKDNIIKLYQDYFSVSVYEYGNLNIKKFLKNYGLISISIQIVIIKIIYCLIRKGGYSFWRNNKYFIFQNLYVLLAWILLSKYYTEFKYFLFYGQLLITNGNYIFHMIGKDYLWKIKNYHIYLY